MSWRSNLKHTLSVFTKIPIVQHIIRFGIQKNLIPKSIWIHLPIEVEFSVKMAEGETFQYIATLNDTMGRVLFWTNGLTYEADTMWLFYQFAKQASTFVDIGANTGVFTLAAGVANPNSRIWAFEPFQFTRHLLEQNIIANNLEARTTIHSEALSDTENDAATFYLPQNISMKTQDYPFEEASLILNEDIHVETQSTIVSVTTLDSIWADSNPCDLVKIDVEGMEARVLLGMSKILKQFQPTLIVEVNINGPAEEVTKILHEFDYTLYAINDGSIQKIEKIVPYTDRRSPNFLAIPNVKQEWLQQFEIDFVY